MGSLTLAYPSIAGKTTQEQLESMRRYLCSVTEQLNLADWSAKATLTETVSYTHLRAHETGRNLVCRLLLEKKKKKRT